MLGNSHITVLPSLMSAINIDLLSWRMYSLAVLLLFRQLRHEYNDSVRITTASTTRPDQTRPDQTRPTKCKKTNARALYLGLQNAFTRGLSITNHTSWKGIRHRLTAVVPQDQCWIFVCVITLNTQWCSFDDEQNRPVKPNYFRCCKWFVFSSLKSFLQTRIKIYDFCIWNLTK